MRADGNEESLVPLFTKLTYGNVLADVDGGLELDAHVANDFNLGFDNISRQTVGGYPHAEHTAEHG